MLDVIIFTASSMLLGVLRRIFKQVLSYKIFPNVSQSARNLERIELLRLVRGRQPIECMTGEWSEQGQEG